MYVVCVCMSVGEVMRVRNVMYKCYVCVSVMCCKCVMFYVCAMCFVFKLHVYVWLGSLCVYLSCASIYDMFLLCAHVVYGMCVCCVCMYYVVYVMYVCFACI